VEYLYKTHTVALL